MSSTLERLANAAAAIAAIALLALAVWFVVQAGLDAVGVPTADAAAVGSAAAIALALVVSDVYLPIGGGPRTDVLRDRAPLLNVRDAVLAGGLGGVLAYLLATAGFDGWIGIGVGAFLGYLAFVVAYREEYAIRPEE